MTRTVDGSTRWISLPFCSRTTQLKSPLSVVLLVLPLNPETVVWSSDKFVVNKRYYNMCIDVPESSTVKWEPGDCFTCECSTIRQVCVWVCVCFSEESRYWVSYVWLSTPHLSLLFMRPGTLVGVTVLLSSPHARGTGLCFHWIYIFQFANTSVLSRRILSSHAVLRLLSGQVYLGCSLPFPSHLFCRLYHPFSHVSRG